MIAIILEEEIQILGRQRDISSRDGMRENTIRGRDCKLYQIIDFQKIHYYRTKFIFQFPNNNRQIE